MLPPPILVVGFGVECARQQCRGSTNECTATKGEDSSAKIRTEGAAFKSDSQVARRG